MAKLTDNNYKYYTNKHGERVMRVSDVIKILAKDQLLIWANMLGFKHISYRDELNRTANIGSLCHEVIEKYFRKGVLATVDYEDWNVSDYGDKLEVKWALQSFFTWFRKFTETHTYKVKFTERVIVGEHLGGTIDCGIDGWEDPDKVIFVDYKTSKSFYLTQFLQLAAYVMLYEEVEGKDTVEGIMVVRLSKDYDKKAEGRFISRKNLEPFIICFQCMYDVACGTRMLQSNLTELTEKL